MKRIFIPVVFCLLFVSNILANKGGISDGSPCLVCYAPYLFEVAGIKATSATFNYDGYKDQAGVYELEYGLVGFVKGTGTIVSGKKLTATIIGLTPNTEYTALLRFKCDSGEGSSDLTLNFKTKLTNDVGVSKILSPKSNCELGNDEKLKIQIKNYGGNPQSLIDVRFSVNQQPISVPPFVDGYYTGVLSTDSTGTFDFDTGFDYSEEGEYKIASWTELKGDENKLNDTTYYTLFHVPLVKSLPYAVNFEPSQSGWTFNNVRGTTGWEFGTPNTPNINTAASGNNCFFARIPEGFTDQVEAYLESPCFDFSDAQNEPYLTFNINYDIDTYYHGIWVEYSKDGGLTWERLGQYNDPLKWYNTASNIFGFSTWAGTSMGWTIAGHKLTELKGESNCRIRIAFSTFYNFGGDSGVAVDNITIYNQIDKDLTAVALTNTSTSECGSENDFVKFTYTNTGKKPIVGPNQVKAYYQFENDAVIEEDVPAAVIQVGDSYTYTFKTKFSSYGPGTYKAKAWVQAVNDANAFNDTTSFSLTIPEPTALPLKEDFEKFLLPEGWIGEGYSITAGHNNKTYVIAGNLFTSSSKFSFTTSNIGPLDGGNTLTFDYRYVDYFAGTNPTSADAVKLVLEISDDCGITFKPLYTIDKSNHIPSADMKNVVIDLSAYDGKIIKLRYRAEYITGDYWVDVDNININGCPLSLGASSKLKNVSFGGANDGAVTITPSKGTAPYTYLWSNSATTAGISGLTAGNYCVTITDANACKDVDCFDVGNCPQTLGVTGNVTPVSGPGKSDGKIALNTPAGTYSYAWSNGATGKSVSFLKSGKYSVTVTNESGCTQVIDFQINAVATHEIKDLKVLNINPNPTNGLFNVVAVFGKAVSTAIDIYNIYGELVYSKITGKADQLNVPVDLGDVPAGFYIMKLSADGSTVSRKIIKIQ